MLANECDQSPLISKIKRFCRVALNSAGSDCLFDQTSWTMVWRFQPWKRGRKSALAVGYFPCAACATQSARLSHCSPLSAVTLPF